MEKLIVVKVGGNIIDDKVQLNAFLKEFGALQDNKILVHGGGKHATALARQLGVEQILVDGRRITDAETLRLVIMVYAGLINKNMVAQLQAGGSNAIGLCGADGNIIQAHKRMHAAMDYGYVGDVDSVNVELIDLLLHQQITIVLCPITHDKKGQLLNTNADTIAQVVAKAMSSSYDTELIYLFEKSGVLLDTQDECSVIGRLDPDSYNKLKNKEVVSAGMIPKLDNAFNALEGGVTKVIIGKPQDLSMLLAGLAGTTISKN